MIAKYPVPAFPLDEKIARVFRIFLLGCLDIGEDETDFDIRQLSLKQITIIHRAAVSMEELSRIMKGKKI